MIDETDVYAILLKRIDDAESDKLREKYELAMTYVTLALEENEHEWKHHFLKVAYNSIPSSDVVARSVLAEFMLQFEP